MVIAFLALLHSQTQETPVSLTIGCSTVLTAAVDKIAEATQKGDFDAARALQRLLPTNQVRLQWDDSVAPEGSRFDFANQRDAVIREWQTANPTLTFPLATTAPDVKVQFAPEGGVALTWSEQATAPRLTITIGLKLDGKTVDPAAVHNELSYALGSYFGVAKLPMPGLLMEGAEMAHPSLLPIGRLESSIASANLSACGRIRNALNSKMRIPRALPEAEIDPAKVEAPVVYQGGVPTYRFNVKNKGTGNLVFRIVPDCSCFSTTVALAAAPGETKLAEARMETREYVGTVHKTLFLFSNDAKEPVKVIPFQVEIKPRFRMYPPRQVLVAGDDGLTFDAFFWSPDNRPIKITGAESEGLPGTVKVSPWTGTMPDPDMNEGPLPRKGYKLTLTVKDIPDGGQFGTNIVIQTNDDTFEEIRYPVFVQKGILALPRQVFMGEIGAAPRTSAFLLTRPGKNFNITDVSADSSHVKVSYEPTKTQGEYRFSVAYDGQADRGDYRATISIKTDDPKQPLIEVPVVATVR